MRIFYFALPALSLLLPFCTAAVRAQQQPNSNAIYQQLRTLQPAGGAFAVNHLELRRDAATFSLTHGTIEWLGTVNGKVTGAIFTGEGHLHIVPPTVDENRSLELQFHAPLFDEDFDELVLRFSDDTDAELKKSAGTSAETPAKAGKDLQDLNSFLRTKLHENVDLRLLADVLSPAQGGYFMAAVHGKKNPHLIYRIDPHGQANLAPEEVSLLNWKWSEDEITYPLAFHRMAEYAAGTANGREHNASYRILNEDLDVTIEKSGFLSAMATVHLKAECDGVVVVPFNLYPALRVSKVEDDKGQVLDFIQEKKEEDSDFGLILAHPLHKDEEATVRITYGGKDVVFNEGGNNYYPVARENWYPNASNHLGDYASYHMLFHIPKGLHLVATGTRLSEKAEGKMLTSEWKTETPLAVVGFNLGEFASKSAEVKTANGSLTINAMANKSLPDFAQTHHGFGTDNSAEASVMDSLSTLPMLGVELSQGTTAAHVYSDYYGPLPFAHIALTQQAACSYGQSWPMLVYLPICGFFDDTEKHFLGLGGENLTMSLYWKVVTAHEVAHQWWSQTVGFNSYRDQWMSEGFADASAAIFLQATRPKPDEFREFWRIERRLITEKNSFGFRPIDVGPVTMGVRLKSPKAGWNIYQDLVYPKGAYILHMLRMMMWTPQEGDARFKATMQEFIASHRLQPVTTEDFKAAVEKHMSPAMDLDGNHRMDWFFNEYVYGTELPTYHFEGEAKPNDSGYTLHLKLTQSGVSTDFKAPVPIYLEFADGRVMQLGSVSVVGNTTVERSLNLGKSPSPIKHVLINYYYNLLDIEK